MRPEPPQPYLNHRTEGIDRLRASYGLLRADLQPLTDGSDHHLIHGHAHPTRCSLPHLTLSMRHPHKDTRLPRITAPLSIRHRSHDDSMMRA
jgi:hypothetical protein